MVNKFHYLKGGSEKYYFELAELLKNNGHEVAFFSMENNKNIKTECKEYFVPNIDLNSKNPFKALNVIYSKTNRKIMDKAIEEFKPDIVHINNFQRQLSASIIKPIKSRNIPIVFTAHDMQAICPNIVMLDGKLELCEDCTGGKYVNCTKKKCIKNSKLKSILGSIEGYYYRIKKIYKQLDCIITPSYFYKDKLIKDGIDKNKIIAIHNCIDIDKYSVKQKSDGKYVLYIGRLSREKGIIDLVEAFSNIDMGKLYIAGDGEEKERIERLVNEKNISERVELVGFIAQDKVNEYISNATVVALPSKWYENCPYSALETIAIGKPIIGSDLGGIPELVEHDVNGLIYKNQQELETYLKKVLEDKEYCEKLERGAERLRQQYSKENYYEEIMKIYQNLVRENCNG
jgi:glycosyltransferase involved in cell wall biosynthesis